MVLRVVGRTAINRPRPGDDRAVRSRDREEERLGERLGAIAFFNLDGAGVTVLAGDFAIGAEDCWDDC